MKSSVCFLCLKTSAGGDKKRDGRLCSTFWGFAKDYLRILSSSASEDKLLPLLLRRNTFCGDCENVVSSICQLYRELLQTQLRLSSKLGELLGLMECSENLVSPKLDRLLIKSIAEQLGFQKTGDVDAIRSLLKIKCKLKRNETLPQVIIERVKPSATDVIKLEITPSELLEEMDMNTDDDVDIHEEGNLSPVEAGTDTEETAPQIKTEPLELDSDDEMIDEGPISKVHRQEDQNDSDSTFEPEVSDSDWATEKKKGKAPVPSTSRKKIPSIRATTHPQKDEIDFSSSSCSLVLPNRRRLTRHTRQVHSGRRHHCSECKNSFKTKSGLKHHVIAFHKPECHPCPFQNCGRTFRTKDYLRRHISYFHTKRQEKKWYKCPICPRSFTKKELADRHLLSCGKSEQGPSSSSSLSKKHTLYKCPTPNCSRSYYNKYVLQRHLLTCEQAVEKNQLGKLSCLSCDKRFNTRSGRIKHMWIVHKLKNQRKIPCPTCSSVFPSAEALTRHVKESHPDQKFSCQECGTVLKTYKAYQLHKVAIHNPEKHICSFCGKVFKTGEYLNSHIRNSHGTKQKTKVPATCDQCGKTFVSSTTMKKHVKRIHEGQGQRTSPCPYCGKVFSSFYNVSVHISNIHPDKQYVCGQCRVSLKTKTELEEHINEVHFGGWNRKRYPCPNCIIVYQRRKTLERHLTKCSSEAPLYKNKVSDPEGKRVLRHDDKPDSEGKFPCPNCPKVYPSAAQRSRHVYSAHPATTFTCDQCGVIRKTSGGLQKHITAAHKPKDRLCPHCGKTLATGYMAVHIRLIHPEFASKRIRYSCPNCPEGYYTKTQLEKHSLECPGTERNTADVSVSELKTKTE